MVYFNCFIEFVIIVTLSLNLVYGNPSYGAEFSEDVVACPGFINEYINADDLKLDSGSNDGNGGLSLNGLIKIIKAIDEGMEMNLKAFKQTELGDEFVFNAVGNICSSLDDENTPWFPVVRAFNTTKCPLPVGDYNAENLTVSLKFAAEAMRYELLGQYKMVISAVEGVTKVMCYMFGVDVFEI